MQCFICRQPGHIASNCPNTLQEPLASEITVNETENQNTNTPEEKTQTEDHNELTIKTNTEGTNAHKPTITIENSPRNKRPLLPSWSRGFSVSQNQTSLDITEEPEKTQMPPPNSQQEINQTTRRKRKEKQPWPL
ncbi:hypothetical protein HHI36_004852 [Cryptolaemus montrouzieri]|uniref:CCHC-type domain-containing protein n=1 Tax=Cryptolaemus montrouzieri TaxID=559131 RepID=A0ABD2NSF3_9CUCU